ncbi:coiled-coil domain-containing 92B-like [Oncorhynchus masou masou]|uniref:coiled-coil domain-containing 92B-like n=1 Tax=Oncorhynchus masou masou TaxID=90313 RepID=UPI0031838ED6
MEPTGSTLDMQMKSVERSTVFLRQEHLTLLHGLHLEILSLQKRCTELTSELNVKPPGKSELDLAEEEEQLEARCLEVEDRLAEQQCTLGELRKELIHKGALVGALRANLKDKERRFLDELKSRSHRSTVLNTELQKQTEAAAYLSFQLHAARQKLHHQRLQQRQQALRENRENRDHHGKPPGLQYSQAAEWDTAIFSPFSPQSPSGFSNASNASSTIASPVVKPKRRGSRATSGHQLRAERARECVPQEKVMGPAEPTAMPDPALFLHPHRRHHRSRARHSHSPAHRQPPLVGERGEEEGGGEGPMEPQDGAPPRMAATATAPPAGWSDQG